MSDVRITVGKITVGKMIVPRPNHARRLRWFWECNRCRWVGLDCPSELFAWREAARHECPPEDRP